ncbi:biopolymer transporter ExbD [Gloeocapsopsis crepidinum LEGE 06123]|uniref:Biopolymer transporter ExbD n=3 Tax=Gloeocapsopsis crepidinum TaxID=693223 RepID=A0ABR9USB1_9CHRO|nr:biopolymer transporter ExbD [Gloeocapsopsis crepidinum]MBE9190525.1 biopolymer transporter ExbD [Gloeocapsopsis crepidinum LEGE 06123]
MFRNQQRNRNSQIPEVNLIPMMDVLMSVLTFFIITSMTLSGRRIANVSLPIVDNDVREQSSSLEPFIVGLNQRGEIIIENQHITLTSLEKEIQSYLKQNPKALVILKADKRLSYKQVLQVLKKMRDVGGDRISLAIEKSN